MFNVKDPIPKSLKSFVVSKFVCKVGMPVTLVRQNCHLSTRIKEHLEKDKDFYIFAQLANNETYKALTTENCFDTIDCASSEFRLKLKEAMQIIWKKPSLKKQQKQQSISITVYSCFIFNCYFHFTLSFPFICSSTLFFFWTSDLIFRFILSSVCNHSSFVNYYFVIKFLIETFIKICKEQFYVVF